MTEYWWKGSEFEAEPISDRNLEWTYHRFGDDLGVSGTTRDYGYAVRVSLVGLSSEVPAMRTGRKKVMAWFRENHPEALYG